MKNLSYLFLFLAIVSFITFIFVESVQTEKICIISAIIFAVLWIIADLFDDDSGFAY